MATGGGEERNYITIIWRIENLSCFQSKFHGNRIDGPYLYFHALEDNWTQLCLFPRGESVADKNVYLRLCRGSPFPIDCEFSLVAWDETPLVTCKGRYLAESSEFSFEMTDCPTQEELFMNKKSSFLPHDTLTIQCRVWKSEGNFPHSEFISTRTRIELAEGSIMWPIAEFKKPNLSQVGFIPVELQFMHGSVAFDLKCVLQGDSFQNSGLLVVVAADKMLREYKVKLVVSISDNRQEVVKLGEIEKSFFVSRREQIRLIQKFMFRENLKEKMCLLMCGESLSLNFHLTAVCKDVSKCIEKTYIASSNLEQDCARTNSTFSEASCQTSEQNGHTPVHFRSVSTFSEASCQTSEPSGDTPEHLQRINNCLAILGENLFSLYQDQTFSDFELCSSDASFPVHRNILCARSPVFSSMFSSKMKESNAKSLDLPDLDTHTLNRMLSFLYTGTVELQLTLDSAGKLYYAADKYQIDSLKSLCSSILQSQISVSNVSDILILADRHQDSELASIVHNFILSHFNEVMLSEGWEKFLDINPVLAGKSAHLLYKKKALKEQPKINEENNFNFVKTGQGVQLKMLN